MTMFLPSNSPEYTYVALATLLPCKLRAYASIANLCFFQVVDHATNAEQLFVRVTALPHRLDDIDSPRVFTVCLSTEQLAKALPWDRAMQAISTCDVRELVELHAKQKCSSTLQVPEVEHPVAVPAPPRPLEEKEISFVALPEVFVSCETVQEVVAEAQVPSGNAPQPKQRRWAQLTWLRAAIAMMRRQLSQITQLQGKLLASLATLDQAIRCAYVAHHRLRQPLVCASPVFIKDRQVGWHLHLGVPVLAALTA